jgi:hypothetical protein
LFGSTTTKEKELWWFGSTTKEKDLWWFGSTTKEKELWWFGSTTRDRRRLLGSWRVGVSLHEAVPWRN